jgi:hypothetical protein
MKALRTAAFVVGAVALAATGVGALGTAGLLGSAIASGGAIAGIATAATLTTFGTIAGAAAAIATLAAGAPKGSVGGSATQFKIDRDAGIPVVIGRTYSGGNIVHRQYYGSKNSLESWVTVHSIGPVRSLGPLLINKVAVALAGTAIGGAYAGYMWLDQQLGAVPEARALAGPQGNFPGWSPAHKLSGLAADLWTLKFDDKGKIYPNGVPQRGRVVEGVYVYDPRLDSTYPGGSGSCRLGDETTYVWSECPALQALTWAFGRIQSGVLVAGGGLKVGGIDMAPFVDWANVCDANGWNVGGIVYTNSDNSWDILKMIAQAGGGEVMPVGAQLSCTYSAPRVSIGTITSEDITGDVDAPGTASRRLRRNTVIARVRLESHGWEEVPLDAVAIPAYVAVDGGSRPTELTFPLVQQVDQGVQLGLYALWNGRELDGIVLPAKVYAIGYRPGDCLTVDIPEASLVSRDVVVRNREIEGSTMGVTLTCRSETFAKHAFCLGKTGNAPPTPDLSVPPAYPTETTRAAFAIVRQSVAYPVDSTDDEIAIAAFSATIDDGRVLDFPAQTIGGLAVATTYIVLWDLTAQTFVAVQAPALTESASSNYVFVRQTTTQNADGTYPAEPTAPGGDGGGGYGGGGCPIVSARILLANSDRNAAGDTIAAGDIQAGDWVWSQHETSGAWGAYLVTFTRVFESDLFAIVGRPLTSPSHLWHGDGGWTRSDVIGTSAGSGKVVALTVADAHTYVLVADDGTHLLSHNKLAQQNAS